MKDMYLGILLLASFLVVLVTVFAPAVVSDGAAFSLAVLYGAMTIWAGLRLIRR